jgi:hypothetical protein
MALIDVTSHFTANYQAITVTVGRLEVANGDTCIGDAFRDDLPLHK